MKDALAGMNESADERTGGVGEATMRTGSAMLTNEVGLHARPSVKLTQLAKSFAGRVEFALAPEGPWIDAKSPVKVMRVKAGKGALLHIRTDGPDADASLCAVIDLITRKFDEH